MSTQKTPKNRSFCALFICLITTIWGAVTFWQIQQLKATERTLGTLKHTLALQPMAMSIHAAAAADQFRHNASEARFWLKIAHSQMTEQTPKACQTALSALVSKRFSSDQQTQLTSKLKNILSHITDDAQPKPTVTKTPLTDLKHFNLKHYLPTSSITTSTQPNTQLKHALNTFIAAIPSTDIQTLHTQLKTILSQGLPDAFKATMQLIKEEFFTRQGINFKALQSCVTPSTKLEQSPPHT